MCETSRRVAPSPVLCCTTTTINHGASAGWTLSSSLNRKSTRLSAPWTPGLDGIGPNVLKSSSLALCGPLLQLCLDTQTIPQEWKLHVITPVHKSADWASVENYRPISLLSSTFKVLECLGISTAQFGFMGGRCTVQQLLLFFYKSVTNGTQVDVIYLDFSEAFDSVPYSIGVNLWNWFKGT